MNRWKYGVAALGVMGTTFFSPVAQAAAVATRAVCDFVRNSPEAFDRIVFVLFDPRTKAAYDAALASAASA